MVKFPKKSPEVHVEATLGELNGSKDPVGVEIIREMDGKLMRISVFKKRTVQKVLITKSEPTAELRRASYLTRIISAEELVA